MTDIALTISADDRGVASIISNLTSRLQALEAQNERLVKASGTVATGTAKSVEGYKQLSLSAMAAEKSLHRVAQRVDRTEFRQNRAMDSMIMSLGGLAQGGDGAVRSLNGLLNTMQVLSLGAPQVFMVVGMIGTVVAGIEAIGRAAKDAEEPATALFDKLKGIGNLPRAGGVLEQLKTQRADMQRSLRATEAGNVPQQSIGAGTMMGREVSDQAAALIIQRTSWIERINPLIRSSDLLGRALSRLAEEESQVLGAMQGIKTTQDRYLIDLQHRVNQAGLRGPSLAYQSAIDSGKDVATATEARRLTGQADARSLLSGLREQLALVGQTGPLLERERTIRAGLGAVTANEAMRLRGLIEARQTELRQLQDPRYGINFKQNAAAVRGLENQSLRDQGRIAEATRRELEEEYKDMINRLDPDGQGLVRHFIDVKVAMAEIQQLETTGKDVQRNLTRDLRDLEVGQRSGVLTPDEVADRTRVAYARAIDGLNAMIDAQIRWNLVANSPEVSRRIAELIDQVTVLRQTLDTVLDSMEQVGLKASNDFINGVQSIVSGVLDAGVTTHAFFRTLALDIVTLLRKIVSEALAAWAVLKLFPRGGEGLLTTLVGDTFLAGMADGGLVSGVGTGTSDSIPARLSHGEYVLRAAAVERLGVEFLDSLNGMRLPAAITNGRYGYASGGEVSRTPAEGVANNVVVKFEHNSLDPRLGLEVFRSYESEVRSMVLRFLTESTAGRQAVLGG